jgi:hypothetical protein
VGATMVLGPILAQKWGIRLLETPIGHMPELCLGIASARYGLRVGAVLALAAAVLFLLGNLYAVLWPLTFVCALIVLLYAYQLTAPAVRRTKFIDRVAEVSMPLFFVNGFLRSPFRRVAIHFDQWYITLVTGFAFAAFSTAVAFGLLKLERRLFSPAKPSPAADRSLRAPSA